MKFCKTTMAFFTLFLLYNVPMWGSIFSDLKRTAKYTVAHPKESVFRCTKAGLKGVMALCSGVLSLQKACKCFQKITDDTIIFEVNPLKSLCKTGTAAAGLALLALECGNSLVDDIKQLR